MKIRTSLAFVASISLLPTTKALVGIDWSITNVPSSGLADITFPVTIVEADHISGYYFAQQYGFVNSSIGYTGIQPRPDSNGKSVLHGVFSSFVHGSTTKDSNCHGGADSPDPDTGVSCSFEWNGVYGRTYDFEVKQNGTRRWVGTAIDTVTKQRIHIGSYTLPVGAQGIRRTQGGFMEWYPWNSGEPPNHCAHLPYQKTIFGTPRTTHTGSIVTQGLAYEYGDCVRKVAFHTERVASGVENNCGFRGEIGSVSKTGLLVQANTY